MTGKILKSILSRLRIVIARLLGARIGNGCMLDKGLDISNYSNISLGDNATLYKNCTIYNSKQGMFKLGGNSHVAPYGYFLIDNNKVEIGNDVAIGPFCSFFCHSNNYSTGEKLFRKNYLDGDIKIGSNVFIGAQCVIQPGTTIEDDVIIAANSVVKGKVESGFIYGGSPANKIKPVYDE